MKMRHASIAAGLLGGLVAGVFTFAAARVAHAQAPDRNPLIFVHGGSGSGAQFQSQAMRFTSNGYPLEYIRVVEYDSSVMDFPSVFTQIDAVAAELRMTTGRPQFDLVGHSRGTTISQQYLSSPERAARVANYVNVDGRVADALPGGVRTLALFAGGAREVQGQIVGATNVTLPDQEHVQAVTSREAFVEMYRFLTGMEPVAGGDIVPQDQFPVSGRAVLFPQNFGVRDGSAVLVFQLDPANAQRMRTMMGMFNMPLASLPTDPDGFFGPFQAVRGDVYELALTRPDIATHTFYMEPFLRTDNLVRLNTGLPGMGLDAITARDPATGAVIIVRNKEFRGDRGPQLNDVLSINGLDIMNPNTAPSGFVGAPVAELVMDVRADGVTNVTQVPPVFGGISFISATDVFMPSSPPFLFTTIRTVPRGQTDLARTLTIRNQPSTAGAVSVNLNDFEQ